MTDDEQEIREAFKVLDRDGNGFISKQELGMAMRSLGYMPSEVELAIIMQRLDMDAKWADVRIGSTFAAIDPEPGGYVSSQSLGDTDRLSALLLTAVKPIHVIVIEPRGLYALHGKAHICSAEYANKFSQCHETLQYGSMSATVGAGADKYGQIESSCMGDGQVDFEEFMTILGPKLLSSETREGFLGSTIDTIFWQFDMQRITLEELKHILFYAFRDHLTMKDIENIIINEEESLKENSGNFHPSKKNRQTCVRKSLICAFAMAFIISVMLIAANQMLRNGME
ncbi:hypothetical protein PAMA_020156 [Pampus argenteus]